MTTDESERPLNRPSSAAMATIAARIAAAQADFEAVRGQVSAELDQMRREFPPLTEAQEGELKKRYRSGAAGPLLRDLQRRVDLGETTWQAIKAGTAPPELTQAYLNSQSKLGQLIKAAADGEDMDESFAEQHRLGHYFAAAHPPGGDPSQPPAAAPNHPTQFRRPPTSDDGDDYSQQESWLE
jgi:hypothetical protein